MKKSYRESNIELLRIVLILMIITHHVIVHGLGLLKIGDVSYQVERPSIYYQLFINSFVVISVNTFVFISGYFGIKFKLKTIASLVFQALFYSLFIYLIFVCFDHSLFGIKSLVKSFLPISSEMWWFLSIYIGLVFVSPFLNKGVEYIEHNQLVIILAGLLFFDCFSGFAFNTISGGHSVFHFMTLYLLARYINKYIPNIKRALLILSVFTLVLFGSELIILHYNQLSKIIMFFSYNNPLIVISSVMLFFIFKNIKLQNRLVNLVSTAIFGVYLIHDHEFVRKLIIKIISQLKIHYSGIEFIFFVIIVILSIFIIGTIIELSRKYVFDILLDKLATIWNTNNRIQENVRRLLTYPMRKAGGKTGL